MTDIQVRRRPLYTYYAGLVWNNGYMGFSAAGNGYFKHAHFSVESDGEDFAELVWPTRAS